jgi:hypothetical protein
MQPLPKERSMFVKSTVIAFAAVAAFGATMLTASTTPADAAGFHRGGHFRGAIGHHVRHDWRYPGRYIPRHPRWSRPLWRHHIYYYPRPVIYAARPVIYGAAPVVTNRCTCLTKEYTPTGAVLFKDICTNEAAINPPSAPVAQVPQ